MSLYAAISQLFSLIELILILRILLTWFPNIDWQKQPFKLVQTLSDPIFEPFRRVIPPIGGFDLSPIAAFLVLGMLKTIVLNLLITSS